MKNIYLLIIFLFALPILANNKTTFGDSTKVSLTKSKKLPVNAAYSGQIDKSCGKMELVILIIDEAISIGAPTYNDGNHAACYKIYEGAAYKILHKYGKKCTETAEVLETALEKISEDFSVTEKAWILRMAFDKILGVPTQTK